MKKLSLIILTLLSFMVNPLLAQMAENIIPKPSEITSLKGKSVKIDSKSMIRLNGDIQDQAILLQDLLYKQTGLDVAIDETGKGKGSIIYLVIDSVANAHPEMYTLGSTKNIITISAATPRGIVYGIHTLLQLMPIGEMSKVEIEPVKIVDTPRFAYRGMHLDVVRHMFPLDFIKKYIDYLSFHKLNTFHWHLNDDQGWRIEILSYPKLNSIGSWREQTLIGHFRDKPIRYDGKRYGGYYTREEIKDVIKYAKVRGIDIIPEIDIPGHNRATIAAYPEFSTSRDSTWNVAITWGMFNRQNNVLCPSPETFKFLETVFHEVADLFESDYIHLGGDECSKMWWKATPWVQDFIKENNLKDESDLQTYMVTQVANYIKAKGKKVIGWDEIIEGELDPSTIIMNWHLPEKAMASAEKNHQIIMCSHNPLYFNGAQSREPREKLASGYNPMEAVYKFNIVPEDIAAKGLGHLIIGGQACLWTEYITTPEQAEYMLFPRLTALSEVLWSTPDHLDYDNFLVRMKDYMVPRYKSWGSDYFPNFEVWNVAKEKEIKDKTGVE